MIIYKSSDKPIKYNYNTLHRHNIFFIKLLKKIECNVI